ncbi:hypothetical protein J4217_04730 [Candidatus Pacearchaeota archaeon]|nr:hypothetical protein [Candidatus Pacearchaeota archaeon]
MRNKPRIQRKNKKGISGIITTLIIVLVVIAIVVVVYNFIRPVLQQNAERVEQQQLGLATSFVIQNYNLNETAKTLDVNVKREAGGNANVVGVIISLEDINGNIVTFRQNLTIGELESKTANIDYKGSNLGDIALITVTPIFNLNGKEIISQQSTSQNIPGREVSPSGGKGGGGIGGGEGTGGGGADGGGPGGQGENAKEYCVDSDAIGEQGREIPIEGQQGQAGLVVVLFDNCKNEEISEDCLITVSAADVCLNAETLAEQTCNKEKHEIVNVNCRCNQGACISLQ